MAEHLGAGLRGALSSLFRVKLTFSCHRPGTQALCQGGLS